MLKLCLECVMLGVFVFSPSGTNVTVMFPSGAGVELRLRGNAITATVLLPEEFHNSTQGLLGNMNGVPGDDLLAAHGTVAANGSNAEEVFSVGASCEHFTNAIIKL